MLAPYSTVCSTEQHDAVKRNSKIWSEFIRPEKIPWVAGVLHGCRGYIVGATLS